MKNIILTATLLSGTVIFAGSADAQARDTAAFDVLDLDGDGALSLDEMQARNENRFSDLDTDGDGGLSEAEMIAAAQSRAENRASGMIARFDKNADRILQFDEAPRFGGSGDRAARVFARLDTDNDGAISPAEFVGAKNNRRHRFGGGHRGRG